MSHYIFGHSGPKRLFFLQYIFSNMYQHMDPLHEVQCSSIFKYNTISENMKYEFQKNIIEFSHVDLITDDSNCRIHVLDFCQKPKPIQFQNNHHKKFHHNVDNDAKKKADTIFLLYVQLFTLFFQERKEKKERQFFGNCILNACILPIINRSISNQYQMFCSKN